MTFYSVLAKRQRNCVSAYYNEIDPKAAATLRELIRVGAIAPGDVDERSIADVAPGDLVGFRQRHFFAGGGVWSYALRLALPKSRKSSSARTAKPNSVHEQGKF